MNASQQKQAIAVAQRALAMLNPDWAVTTDLKAQLELCMVQFAETPKAKTARKSSKIKKYQPYKPFSAEEKLIKHVFEGTLDKDGNIKFQPEWKDTKCQCVGCKIGRGFFVDRGMAPVKMMKPEQTLETPEAIRNRLSHCACGGLAEDHKKDELENLLKCSHCDNCESFHYETADDQQAAA